MQHPIVQTSTVNRSLVRPRHRRLMRVSLIGAIPSFYLPSRACVVLIAAPAIEHSVMDALRKKRLRVMLHDERCFCRGR